MQQVLFWIPDPTGHFPDGIPIHGFGVMLFLTFLACIWFASRRARLAGVNITRERMQDLCIVLFVVGLLGARLVYVAQEKLPWGQFFKIWEGGIVLYGGILAGIAAFIGFHHFVLKRFGVGLWQLADTVAPAVALGIALGRVGCLLNGCCYGQVADGACPSVGFPTLTCPARKVYVEELAYQTLLGFSAAKRDDGDDLRTVVGVVEPESAAGRAGVKPGDRIVKVNGRANAWVLTARGPEKDAAEAAEAAKQLGAATAEVGANGDPRGQGDVRRRGDVPQGEGEAGVDARVPGDGGPAERLGAGLAARPAESRTRGAAERPGGGAAGLHAADARPAPDAGLRDGQHVPADLLVAGVHAVPAARRAGVGAVPARLRRASIPERAAAERHAGRGVQHDPVAEHQRAHRRRGAGAGGVLAVDDAVAAVPAPEASA